MDLEQIDNGYKKEIEDLDTAFATKRQNKEKLEEVEQEYRKRSDEIRKKYHEAIVKALKSNKPITKKKKKKKEKTKHFKVEELPSGLSNTTKARIKAEIGLFKTKIRVKNGFDKFYYPHAAYVYFKIKYAVKRVLKVVARILEKVKIFLQDTAKAFWSWVKKTLKASYKKPFELMKKLLEKMAKKKDKKEGDGKEEKSDEEDEKKEETKTKEEGEKKE